MEWRVYEPSASHHFSVLFWLDRMPLPDIFDMRFQRVGGLSRELGITTHSEGGENLRNQYFVEKLSHGSRRSPVSSFSRRTIAGTSTKPSSGASPSSRASSIRTRRCAKRCGTPSGRRG
jgi:hypothetical protein